MFRELNRFEARRALAAGVISAALAAAAVVVADDEPAPASPPVLFSAPLPDVPGKHLVVVELAPPPRPATADRAPTAHRHPGSVYVHVTRGAVRMGLEGEPVEIVRAGGSFFEPAGVLHTVIENVSASEPARAIAVMIVPDGAPLAIPESEPRP